MYNSSLSRRLFSKDPSLLLHLLDETHGQAHKLSYKLALAAENIPDSDHHGDFILSHKKLQRIHHRMDLRSCY